MDTIIAKREKDCKMGNGTWEKGVDDRLAYLTTVSDTIRDKIENLHIELAQLKVRAALWGAAAGLMSTIVAGVVIALVLQNLGV